MDENIMCLKQPGRNSHGITSDFFFLHRTLLLNRVPGEFKVALGHLVQPYTVYVQTIFKQKLTYLNTMVLHTKFLQQL